MAKYADEIKLHLGQAITNLQAAKELLAQAQYDAAVTRAGAVAVDAGRALLFDEGLETSLHGDVIPQIQLIFVNGRRLTQEQGEKLNWLTQLAEAQKSPAEATPSLIQGEAQKAVEFAESFFAAARVIIEA